MADIIYNHQIGQYVVIFPFLSPEPQEGDLHEHTQRQAEYLLDDVNRIEYCYQKANEKHEHEILARTVNPERGFIEGYLRAGLIPCAGAKVSGREIREALKGFVSHDESKNLIGGVDTLELGHIVSIIIGNQNGSKYCKYIKNSVRCWVGWKLDIKAMATYEKEYEWDDVQS